MKNVYAMFVRCLTLVIASVVLGKQSFAQTPITISVLPTIYWAFPMYLATEKGWWAEAGLAPKFVTYPAGLPQVNAAAEKAWDVGSTGSVPGIIGADKYQLEIIGISNDESATNALYATPAFAERYRANTGSLRGQKIMLTANSTVDFAAQACLARSGLLMSNTTWVGAPPKDVLAAVSAKDTEIAGLWAPNTYVAETAGWVPICSGKDARVLIPGLLVARPEFSKANPDAVARFLAVYLRGWQWVKANPLEAEKMLKAYYTQGGLNISDSAIRKEFSTRPTFSLAEQIDFVTSSPGSDSKLAFALQRMGIFLRESGAIASTLPAQRRITDRYMRLIERSPQLSAIATNKK
jgi:ABC-type nitrate/sulfonate/bicarbonate transport system substrate-binding protein